MLTLRAICRWPSFCSKCSRRISLIFLMDFRFPGNFGFGPPLRPVVSAHGFKSSAAVFPVLLSFRSPFSHPDHQWRDCPKVIGIRGERRSASQENADRNRGRMTDRFQRRMGDRNCGESAVSMRTTIEELAPYMRGGRGYFGRCDTPEVLISLIRWVRLRLRAALWRQWKTPRRRRAALLELGVRSRLASNTAGSGLGPWYLARAKALSVGLSNAYFESLGLPSLVEEDRYQLSNRRVRTRTHGGV